MTRSAAIWAKNLFNNLDLFGTTYLSLLELETLGDTLVSESDRGVILCFLSAADHLLTEALIHNSANMNPRLKKDLFNSQGPLSALSAKINIAYQFGIISSDDHLSLHAFRKTRNELAHTWAACDLFSGRCKDLLMSAPATCQARSLFDDIATTTAQTHGGIVKTSFRDTIDYAMLLLLIRLNAKKVISPTTALTATNEPAAGGAI